MVTSIVLLSLIVPSRHTGIGAWVNSEMFITIILYNIINCHARVFYEKRKKEKGKKRTNLDLLSIPRLWGGETWCPCVAINVSVQYNRILPDMILLTQCYYNTIIGEPV